MNMNQAIKEIEHYYKNYNPIAIIDDCLMLIKSCYEDFDTKEDYLKAIEECLKSYKEGVACNRH